MSEQKSRTILIVEDETFLRELYEELLNEAGYGVVVAQNGQQAIQEVEKNNFDLTLLDIMLPEKDGLTMLEDLQKSNKLERLGKVVMLTNLGQDAIIKKGFDLGAVGYLIKSSYTPDQILQDESYGSISVYSPGTPRLSRRSNAGCTS